MDVPEARRLLAKPSRPLIDKDRQFVLGWSPKSACTTLYIWFASIGGFLDEVLAHHWFPHKHRNEVLLRSAGYREALRAYTPDFRFIKVIRDPYMRAASIFRHAVGFRFADADLHARFGPGVDSQCGVSFQQFLDLLAGLDMTTANPHYRPQLHPFEQHRRADKIINISRSDLLAEFAVLEKTYGWPPTDFANSEWFRKIENTRGETPGQEGEPLDRAMLSHGSHRRAFPGYAQLLTPEARRKIERIYARDFEAYAPYL
jgi:hypothetical protein